MKKVKTVIRKITLINLTCWQLNVQVSYISSSTLSSFTLHPGQLHPRLTKLYGPKPAVAAVFIPFLNICKSQILICMRLCFGDVYISDSIWLFSLKPEVCGAIGNMREDRYDTWRLNFKGAALLSQSICQPSTSTFIRSASLVHVVSWELFVYISETIWATVFGGSFVCTRFWWLNGWCYRCMWDYSYLQFTSFRLKMSGWWRVNWGQPIPRRTDSHWHSVLVVWSIVWSEGCNYWYPTEQDICCLMCRQRLKWIGSK